MYSLLSPDHERLDHRMLRVLSDGSPATRGPEESQRPDSRVPENPYRASSETLHGDSLQGVLQRPGWFCAMTSVINSAMNSSIQQGDWQRICLALKASCIRTKSSSSGAS